MHGCVREEAEKTNTRRTHSAAQDLQAGRNIAIKKICKVFECLTDAVRTLREIKLLHHFRHENVCVALVSCKDLRRTCYCYLRVQRQCNWYPENMYAAVDTE